MRFELQQNKLSQYFIISHTLLLILAVAPIIGVFSLIALDEGIPRNVSLIVITIALFVALLIMAIIIWSARKFSQSLEYYIEDDILHVEEGVFTYQRKAIPLDRVTDIRLVQNILMRWLGFWKIQVQTASLGQLGAEGTLWAIDGAKEVRNQLLVARKTAVAQSNKEPAT